MNVIVVGPWHIDGPVTRDIIARNYPLTSLADYLDDFYEDLEHAEFAFAAGRFLLALTEWCSLQLGALSLEYKRIQMRRTLDTIFEGAVRDKIVEGAACPLDIYVSPKLLVAGYKITVVSEQLDSSNGWNNLEVEVVHWFDGFQYFATSRYQEIGPGSISAPSSDPIAETRHLEEEDGQEDGEEA